MTRWPGFLRPCACSRVPGPAEPGSACRRRTHVQAPGALRPWLPPAVLLSVVCAWRSADSHGSCFLPCEPCLRLRQKPSWESNGSDASNAMPSAASPPRTLGMATGSLTGQPRRACGQRSRAASTVQSRETGQEVMESRPEEGASARVGCCRGHAVNPSPVPVELI